MKKHLFLALALTIGVAGAIAQNAIPFKVDIGKYEEEFTASDNTATNSKVLNSFNKMFAGASNVKWVSEGRYSRVYFESKGKSTRATFNQKGQMMYSITTYGEELLPESVLMQVKRAYYGRSIFGVTEVSALGKTAHIIVLQDKTTWLHIKVIDGEIEETELYRRADL